MFSLLAMPVFFSLPCSALLADSIDFEGLPVSTAFVTKHLKVAFANAIILAAGVSVR
jgi:hypothetical protein